MCKKKIYKLPLFSFKELLSFPLNRLKMVTENSCKKNCKCILFYTETEKLFRERI